MTLALAACAVCAAFVALVAPRIEHMAIALGIVGGTLAIDLVGRGATSAAVVLIAGSALAVVIVLVAVALVEVDARPVRRLQPWKLLLLSPLVGIAVRVAALPTGQPTLPLSARVVAGAIVVLGLLALAIPLLVRRRQGGLLPGARR